MLKYRRVLVDRQPVKVAEPGQCLIDTGVASSRVAGRLLLGRLLLRRHVVWQRLLRRCEVWQRLLRRHVVWPGRRDAVTMALHQAALLSSARISRVRWFSEERYRPEPTGRVTRRADSTPDPPLRGAELQNGHCLGG
jgi:hypothetical protein